MAMITTTTRFFRDPEEHQRRLADLMKDFGGSEGSISEVSLGTRTVSVPSSPHPPVHVPGPESSYMARKRKSAVKLSAYQHEKKTPSEEEVLLLDKMHRYHLEALATVEKRALWRLARGMIFAGYTYGSLRGPVENIVANSLWYESAFPTSSREHVQVKMLSGKAIFRMACRSLDTVMAFMRYYAPMLSHEEVCSLLVRVGGDLHDAIELLGIGRGDTVGAFRAAVMASDLPDDAVREAHLSFVTGNSARDFLNDRCLFMRPSSSQSPHSVFSEIYLETRAIHGLADTPTSNANLSPPAYRALRLKIHSFRMEEELSLRIVQLAIQKLALQFKEPFELHMICGKQYVIFAPESYYHINFLASPKGSRNRPTLFFAEVRATLKDVDGRCFACGYKGVKLIHPVDAKFNGVEDPTRDHKFMPDPTLDFGAPLNEDYIYFELDQHPEIAKFLEAKYSYMNEDQVDLSFLWFENYLP